MAAVISEIGPEVRRIAESDKLPISCRPAVSRTLSTRRRSVKKEGLGFKVALFLFFLSAASWAQSTRCADPLWRAMGIAAESAAAPLSAQPASLRGGPQTNSSCTASANCGGSPPVGCSGSGTCKAVDQNCSVGQQGYVMCDSVVTYCPNPCLPNCDQYDSRNCDYSWDPSSFCCVVSVPFPAAFCPAVCF